MHPPGLCGAMMRAPPEARALAPGRSPPPRARPVVSQPVRISRRIEPRKRGVAARPSPQAKAALESKAPAESKEFGKGMRDFDTSHFRLAELQSDEGGALKKVA